MTEFILCAKNGDEWTSSCLHVSWKGKKIGMESAFGDDVMKVFGANAIGSDILWKVVKGSCFYFAKVGL